MAIQKRIQRVLAKKVANADLKKLSEFYEQMKKSGAVLKKGYTLPPLDTIGRELYTGLVSKTDQQL